MDYIWYLIFSRFVSIKYIICVQIRGFGDFLWRNLGEVKLSFLRLN